MYQPKSIYTDLALRVIIQYTKYQNVKKIEQKEIHKQLRQNLACFVSIHMQDNSDSLRGCIGTIEPCYKNLFKEIISNAISASSKDYRFSPLSIDELENIKISVDVLTKPEKINSIEQLNVKKYGIIVSDGQYKKGVLLPNLDSVDTVEKQINIVKQKAGIYKLNNDELDIYRFLSTRYN